MYLTTETLLPMEVNKTLRSFCVEVAKFSPPHHDFCPTQSDTLRSRNDNDDK